MVKKTRKEQKTHRVGLSLRATSGNRRGGRKPSLTRWAFCMENFLTTIAGKIAALISGAALLFSGALAYNQAQPVAQTASVVAATVPSEPIQNIVISSTPAPASSSATTTIVNQYITQPVIERTVQTVAAPTSGYVTENELSQRLATLSDAFARTMLGTTYPAPATTYASGGVWNSIALMGKIDNLSGTNLSSITVDGVSGLTAADIPSLSYLPLSGGTLTGALINSGTASSTFAGAVGIGSTTPAGQLTLDNWTVNTSGGSVFGGNAQFRIHGMLDATNETLRVIGAQWDWDTAGASIGGVRGLRIYLNPGYTGSGTTHAGSFNNLTQGTHTFNGADEHGNIGVTAASQGGYADSTTVGDNVGLYAIGGGSQNNNIGVYGRGADNTLSPPNTVVTVGVAGQSGNTSGQFSTMKAMIGGAFNIGSIVSHPSWLSNPESTALLLDNDTTGAPLLIGRVNAVNALTLTATGGITSTSTTNSTKFWQVFDSSGNPVFNIDTTNARVGIGTTTPAYNLTVSNPASTAVLGVVSNGNSFGLGNVRLDLTNGDNNRYSWFFGGSDNTLLRLQYNGSTKSIFNSSGYLTLGALVTANNPLFVSGGASIGSGYNTAAPTNGLIVEGNVGVGTTTPWRTFSVTGTVGFDGLTGATGAGSLCLDSNKQVVYNSGSDACLSSTRATKHDIQNLNLDALTLVNSLQPVSFVYNNDASSTVRYGFIAEDTAAVDTHLATRDANGNISGIDDRSIIAIVVEALQSLIDKVGGFAEKLVTREIVAKNIDTDSINANTGNIKQLNTDKLCVGSTCLTESQVQALLNQAGQQAAATPVPQLSTETPNPDESSSTPEITTPTSEAASEPTPSTDSGSSLNQNPDDSSPTTATIPSTTEAVSDTTQTTDPSITATQAQEDATAQEN